MIYILFFSLISFFIITYFVFKEDILSPAVIVCMMWTFSTLCAIYNINNWGINLHLNTVAIIILGIIIFGLSSILAFCLKVPVKLHRCNKTVEDKSILIKKISFNRIIFYIILFINIYTVLWQFNWLLSQTDLSAGWTDMMAKFRSNSSD